MENDVIWFYKGQSSTYSSLPDSTDSVQVLHTQTEHKSHHSIQRKKLYLFSLCTWAYNAIQAMYGPI